ncbi:MAG: SDR family NAD(P)-dependent oxidoreductase [Blastocatellia bacterium]
MRMDRETVAVLTGAGSGIGRALAIELAGRCGGLALADVDREGLAETRAQLGAASSCRVSEHLVDVADRAAMTQFRDEVLATHGAVHLLVNNAGVALIGTVEEVSLEDLDWLLGINLHGVLHGVKLFLPTLLQQDRGHIVNISSVFGIIAPPGQAAYAASKFAVRGFTEALRHELSGSRVGVSVVHPGGIRTKIARRARAGAGADPALAVTAGDHFDRVARTRPEAAAAKIVRGIERDAPRILIGPDAWLIDRVQRWFPIRYGRLMRRFLEP